MAGRTLRLARVFALAHAVHCAAVEGKLVAIVGESAAEIVLKGMRRHPSGAEASIIGVVTEKHPKMVVMATGVGGTRVVDLHPGEILPRIC